MSNAQEQREIQSLARSLKIMEFIGKNKNCASLTLISRELNLSKGTVHGLLSTLKQHGYVKQLDDKGKYALDLKLFELGQIVSNSMDIKEICRGFIERLADKYGETVHLGILLDGEMMCLDKVHGIHNMGMLSKIGARLPAHCTGNGKALLSGLSGDEIKKIVETRGLAQYTKYTIVTYEDLIEDMEQIRKRGYAIDNEEIEYGLRCVACPVRDNTGKIVAAISISAPITRMKIGKLEAMAKDLMETCKLVSIQLGYGINTM